MRPELKLSDFVDLLVEMIVAMEEENLRPDLTQRASQIVKQSKEDFCTIYYP